MTTSDTVHVPLKSDTRDELRGLKRGSMTYDDLFQQMIEVYDPDEHRAKA